MENENKIYDEKLINCIHDKYNSNKVQIYIQIIFFFTIDYNEEAFQNQILQGVPQLSFCYFLEFQSTTEELHYDG